MNEEAPWTGIKTFKNTPTGDNRTQKKASKKAHQERKARDQAYESFNIEPTDGYSSRLEALWVAEFDGCDSFQCVECVRVPLWIDGPFGRFLSDYKPDIVISLADGTRVFVELKPNHELAMDDDRQKRALELNPRYRFVVIGGYPYQKRGVTVRMLTGDKEVVHKNTPVSSVLELLECGC